MSADLLSRATDTGFPLEGRTPSTSVELANVDEKAYVTGGITDILNARNQAARLLEYMDAVYNHLKVMLDAAKNKYRAYNDVLHLVEHARNEYNKENRVAEDSGVSTSSRERPADVQKSAKGQASFVSTSAEWILLSKLVLRMVPQ
jgi:hypothetical protein